MKRGNFIQQIIFGFVFFFTGGLFLSGCTSKEPVRIGFAGELTGRQAELSVQGRNGAQLAVEQINAAGGIAGGRMLEMVVRDDLGTAEGAKQADRELMAAGVVAIVGHSTSSQTLAGLAVTEPAGMVMVSGTTSTDVLSGKEDHFFRVIQTLRERACGMARHIYQVRGVRRTAVIYDLDNEAYSRSYLEIFQQEFRSLGGEVSEHSFRSSRQENFDALLAGIRASNAGAAMLIASDMDTALLAQRMRLMQWPVPLFCSAWAQTEALLHNGGQAIEGMELEETFPMNSPKAAFLEFRQRYQARFGNPPSFSAALHYEAVQVLATALNKTGGKAAGLEPALTGIRDFSGLVDVFSLNRYGDAVRPYYMAVIRNGQFISQEAVQPTGR